MVQTRAQQQAIFTEETQRLGDIQIEQTNNNQAQNASLISYRPSQFIMANKIVQTLLAKKLEEAPKFEGKSDENVLKWLKNIGNAFKLAKLDDSTNLALIANYLGGEAEIAKTYSSPAAQQLAAQQLQNRKQGLQESVMHYYNDIHELCEAMDNQMTDQSKLIYLSQGLKLSLHKEVAQKEERLDQSYTHAMQLLESSDNNAPRAPTFINPPQYQQQDPLDRNYYTMTNQQQYRPSGSYYRPQQQ
ncbi:unnamed protein product [Didymodactylos carnosus]|uniref:Gag protein n=1 Tax=Didymodactylos carnosus TaxID=1234261 RepID=A0A816D1T3_9BILA|nr:unnamed protein product [Didymodactylos carnosus]CAF1629714.1 unnamed protein product [Didymodactylos carnosus]CAF4428062.1 unnamed protein product [Didymodactylos carnosus]CAF4527313.1 unnamed protein product [Didymodactylos carnosus]